ncbi:ATP-binding protein [Pendulispora albinea]|uniref:Tetratricopeptide repeat protein n=1 Tax=Pendulispora albinea TaxID=2741071 RepID=A0ABZ2M5T8_9BACT
MSFASSQSFASNEHRATLVGRAAEMHELHDALRNVRDKGRARTVTILGAAGIGKTRLVRDFLSKMRGPHDRAPRVFRGSARAVDAEFGIFARILRARFGLVDGMDPEAAMAQLRSQVTTVLGDTNVGDICYFLGKLVGLDFPPSPLIHAVEAAPGEGTSGASLLRRAIVKRFLEADAGANGSSGPASGGSSGGFSGGPGGRAPIVLVFDDLHHAHDASLDLLSYLIDHLQAPILVLCMARPEILARRDTWFSHGSGRHHWMELAPLSEADAQSAMNDLLSPSGDDPARPELVEAACNLAGGNPALLDQMVRIFLDMGVLEAEDELAEEERWRIHVDKLEDVRLPLTVEDAVQARIAALAPAERDLLERAATMGAVFWLGGLLAIHRLEQPTPEFWAAGDSEEILAMRQVLRDLTERDYILKLPDSTFPHDEEYVFKHNLEREALVKLIPPLTARRYHAQLADWLSFKAQVHAHEETMGMLARHREAAGAPSQAAAAFLEAGDVARAQYANSKAVEYYALGLSLLSGAGIEANPDQRIFGLHHYGDVLQALGRNEDALSAFREMLTRAHRLDLRARGGAAHGRIGRLYRDTGQLDEAKRHLDTALALFAESEDERGIASTVDDIGKLHFLRGDYHRALEYTGRALAMRRQIGDRRSIALSLNNLGKVYQDSGQFTRALECFEQALQIRREIGDLVGVVISLNDLGMVAEEQHDDHRALPLYHEAYEVAKGIADRNRMALVLTNLGKTLNRVGEVEKAIFYLKQAEELADELGDKVGLAEAVRGLGRAYLARREYTKARECMLRAMEMFTEVQNKVEVGIALRALAEVSAEGSAGGEWQENARAYVLQSIEVFEEIGNDVELARSCRAYAAMLHLAAKAEGDPNLAAEADSYARRAEEIFEKLNIRAFGIDPDAFFASRQQGS